MGEGIDPHMFSDPRLVEFRELLIAMPLTEREKALTRITSTPCGPPPCDSWFQDMTDKPNQLPPSQD